jgi:hypothetical protein
MVGTRAWCDGAARFTSGEAKVLTIERRRLRTAAYRWNIV